MSEPVAGGLAEAHELPALPRGAAVASLLAGRMLYRLAMYAAGLVLLAVWGPHTFAAYATATGSVGWLFALTSSGPEKAALLLLPRAGGSGLERFFVALATVPFGALVVLAVVLAAWAPGAPARLALAAALVTGVGSCALLVGLFRLRGRMGLDALTYTVIAAGYAVMVAVVAVTGAGVSAALAIVLAVVAVPAVALGAGLWSSADRSPVPPGVRREAWRASAVLGVWELLSLAGVSVLYAWLGVLDEPRETSLFYVLAVITSCLSVGLLYALRLVQPRVSAVLERRGEDTGWRWARRILAWLVVLGAPVGVVLVVVATRVTHGGIVPWLALAFEAGVFAASAVAVMLLENSGARGRGWSAAGAVVELAVVAVVGGWLVLQAGAAGALTAIGLAALVKAGVLVAVARRTPGVSA